MPSATAINALGFFSPKQLRSHDTKPILVGKESPQCLKNV